MNYIFVDLDDTIIETTVAKTRFFASLNELSQTPVEEIEATYQSLKSEIGDESWYEQFTTALANQTGIIKNQVKDLLTKSYEQATVDQDLLTYLAHVEAKKILFTYGNEKFQNKKLDLLDLRSNFDEIIVTAEDKAEYFLHLASKIDSENIAIIDDNRKTLKTIKQKNQKIETFTKEQLFDFIKSQTKNQIEPQTTIGGTI